MASAGVNVPGAGSDGGVGNPTTAAPATPAAATQECRMRSRRRRRRHEPQQGSGSGTAAGPSWVRRIRPAATRFSISPSSSSSPPPSAQSQSPAPSQGSGAGNNDDGHQQEAAAAAADPPEEVQEMQLAPLPPAGLQLQPAVAEPQPEPQDAVAVAVAAQVWPVAFGCLSLAGRMRMMEDTVSLHPDLCTWPAADGSPVHLFAVFDGHGGSHVSALCRERMHEFVAEELAREGALFLRRRQERLLLAPRDGGGETSLAAFLRGGGGGGGPPVAAPAHISWSEQEEEERAWRAALARSFRRVDAMAALACGCGRVTRPSCTCPLSGPAAGIVGSTAVVALLVRGRVVVANCGDSRAVLCRGPAGTPPVPLSDDHKPNRQDEAERIAAAGGRVVYNNGHRVRGILAMSRAIGDRLLRPEVIPVPEFTITERTAEDQCLILATDGMWDVITNDVACNVARECLEDGNPPPADDPAVAAGHHAEPRCLRAASLLARLAIGRETQDNISIIVVDLKHRE